MRVGGHLQEGGRTLVGGQMGAYERAGGHLHEGRTLTRTQETHTRGQEDTYEGRGGGHIQEGRNTPTRRQEDTYRRAGVHLRESRRTLTRGQEGTCTRAGHLREHRKHLHEGRMTLMRDGRTRTVGQEYT